MPDFWYYALFGGLMLAVIAGPLGSFIIWQRKAYFGDTIAHASLLGVALAIFFEVSLELGIFIVCILISAGLIFFEQKKELLSDTVLGILSHSSLALGLMLLAIMPQVRVDVLSLLYGDILAISKSDLVLIFVTMVAILVLVKTIWQGMLAITIHEELAKVDGINVNFYKLVFSALVALMVAMALKLIGALLIMALLIIPQATAALICKTPKQMVIIASLNGMLAVSFGLYLSSVIDAPSGPAIVVISFLLFVLVQGFALVRKS